MVNTINTRLILRNDPLLKWNESIKPLLKGEAALAQLSGELSNYFQLRIGVDGTKTWKDLEPSNILIPVNNVDGLTYSKYELRKVSAEGVYPIQYKLFGLKNKVLGGAEEWVAVTDTAIEIPEVDFSLVNGKIDQKLAKIEFEKLSNDIGLSAASPTNQVATKNDIADLAGAMHFRGITTSELATGSKIIPEGTGYYDEGAGKVPTAGDVIVNATTAKEFVWIGAKYGIDGSDGKWVELGDEQLYLTKAAASELSTTLTGKIGTETTRAQGAESFLSTAIDQKIYIDGQKTQTLSLIHDNADDYYQKVINGTVFSNELYILSGDFIDAYGQQIKNIAEPTELSDATTKKYVDDKIVETKGDVAALELSVQQLSTYTHALSVSQLVLDIDTISCGNAD